MRDRGITRPGVKAVLAAGLALAGAAAVAWSAQAPADAPGPARPLGIVALIVGTLAMLNYLHAWTLVRRMCRGERVIGRWTVAPATFARFREAERARRKGKNNWRMPRRSPAAGLEVIFTDHSVLAGETYFSLRRKGMSQFTHAMIEPGDPAAIQFSMRLTVIGAGTQSRTARYRGHLRIPIADNAHVEAARVLGHFRI